MALVKLGDVAREYKATIKNAAGLPVVGLEHLTPRELILESWDSDVETTFTKGFKKGHILFGRRRAYLKKAAIAPFEGICSGDITVIEAIPGKINPDLLPFVIQNDSLFDFAIGKSAGSLSPRVKWEQLKDYTFELPEMDKQQELVDILTAALQTKKAYQRQLAATDELVKSQFIEMFGTPEDPVDGVEYLRLGDVATYINGYAFKPEDWGQRGLPIIRIQNLTGTNEDFNYYDGVYPPKVEINDGDVLISWSASLGVYLWTRGKAILNQHIFKVEFDKMPVEKRFFMYAVEQKLEEMSAKTHGSTMKHIVKKDFDNTRIAYPSKQQQTLFAALAEQSDKSKFELEQAIQRIDNLIKSLIQQNND